MRRRHASRLLIAGALLVAAGTLARTGPWQEPALPVADEASGKAAGPSAAAPGAAPEAADRNAARPDRLAGAETPDAGAAGRDATASASAPPRLSRGEAEAFLGAILEAAASPPPPLSAADALPAAPALVVDGLAAPLFLLGLPGDERLFLVERSGVVRIFQAGALRPTPFLDIHTQVGLAGEGGLLGMAFAPDFATSGLFYLYYIDLAGDSRLSRFAVTADPNVADASSEEIVLAVPQPQSNHNGGTIAFSPSDGMLYLGLGDGGGANDPTDNAQNGLSPLGSMLRLDVSGGLGSGFTIPANNPFVGDAGVLDGIWDLGLRNPFRFSFDTNGDLWIGDVGQGAFEEIDYEAAGDGGRNFEWDFREGTGVNPNGSSTPTIGTLTLPVLQYAHAAGSCGSGGSGTVTGGVVYRGPWAAIAGEYFFADYCTGKVTSYDRLGPTLTDRTAEFGAAGGPGIVAFGLDGFGAMYVVKISGSVFRVGPTGNECDNAADDDGDGRADAADPGCASADDPSEHDPDIPCDDGFDNDGDGAIDTADADCPFPGSDGENPPPDDGGGGGGGDSSSGCGLGFELALLLPALGWLRGRRLAAAASASRG